MNKIEKIKKQALEESMKSGMVILGAVGGLLVIKGIRKMTEDNPTMDTVAQYALPVLFSGGGILLAAATDEKSKAKYFGYGLTVAGAIEGVKLIPVAKDYLTGILGETEIPAASAFFTESDEQAKLMEGLGLDAVPVGNAAMQEAPSLLLSLPELGDAEETNEDLGYNSSTTEDSDAISGIL